MAGISKFLVVDSGAELRFALCSPDGAVLARGRYPAEAPVTDLVVISDLSLLLRVDLFQHSASGLVGHVVDRKEPGDLITKVARRWAGTPARLRATVRASDLYEYGPHLELRREYLRSAERTAANLLSYLRANFADYAALLAPRGTLLEAALPLLHRYPTPRHLGSEGELRLKAALEKQFAGTQFPIIDGFLQLHRGDVQPYTGMFNSYSEQYVRGAVEGHRFYTQLAASIDASVHDLMLPRSEGAMMQPRDAGAPVAVIGAAGWSAEPVRDIDVSDDQLFGQLLELAVRAASPDRNARLELDRYRGLRSRIDAGELCGRTERLRAALIGQRLALAGSEYVEAMQLRSEALSILGESDPDQEISDRDAVETELLCAITSMITAGEASGFDTLRALLKDPRSERADPSVVSEACGAMLLILVIYGEHHKNDGLRERARAAVAAAGEAGAARAAYDIAELYIVGALPGATEQQLQPLIAAADEHSRETAYRPFFNFVMMLMGYVTGRSAEALGHFDEIERSQVWSRFNTALYAHAQLTAAIHHAGLGDYGEAHSWLGKIGAPSPLDVDSGLQVRIDVFKSMLDLVAGRHQEIFERTGENGRLSEEYVGRSYTRRYLSAVYIMRGTALVRDGAVALGHLSFMRAAQLGIASKDWLVLLFAQTTEFHDWLSQLPADQLPDGLTPEMQQVQRELPVFLSHELPQLSEQQERVLELLSLGRATSAIAAELSISGNTLKTHIRRLYQRLGVNSRREAVHVATAYGFFG